MTCKTPIVHRLLPALLLCCLLAPPAAAQDEVGGPDAVAADLFRQGRDLVKKGQWEEGCEKLAASMKRYPAASTLMNLARCREHEGRVASAWAMYQRALVLNRETAGAKRRKQLDRVGREAVTKLAPRLPRLRIRVKPPIDGAVVREAGRELPLDTAVPLDPGPHQLLASAPGHQPLKRDVELREGETLAVELTLQPRSAAEPVPPPKPRPKPEPPTPAPIPSPGVTSEDIAPPIWMWIGGSLGIVFAGLSIGFVVDSTNALSELERRCGDDLVCDEDLSFDPGPLNARKNRSAGLAIGFGVGAAAGIAVGIAGMVSWRGDVAAGQVSVAPLVGPGIAGASLSGHF